MYIYIYIHLKFVRMKKFFTTELIRKYLSSIQIFEKIIDRDSFAKVLNNNLFFCLSYSLSNFNLLESHIAQFHVGFKK